MPGVRGGPHRQRHSPRGVQAVPGGYSRSRERRAAVPVRGVDCAPVKKRGVLRKVLDQAKGQGRDGWQCVGAGEAAERLERTAAGGDRTATSGASVAGIARAWRGVGEGADDRAGLGDVGWGAGVKYEEFIASKSQIGGNRGFAPLFMPSFLFDFQSHLTDWALRKGAAALFEDCGMGKTAQQIVWAENVLRHTNKPVLILTPLAVSHQTVREGEKFGVDVRRCKDGKLTGPGIYVANYERLHYFDRHQFDGVVCDESSAIKTFEGETQKAVTEFMREIPYRLLCTATAAPNDYIELGTSAEALGELGRMDMVSMFFKNDENSNHPIWWGARWRFKAHAEMNFWRWVCSWARCVRKPSDLGFDDGGFNLPPLILNQTVVQNEAVLGGRLFAVPAVTLAEQREERKITIKDRCEMVQSKVIGTGKQSLIWCHLNAEGDLLEKIIPGARQVSGKTKDEEKEELFRAFQSGQIKDLITKPEIGGFGLNFQNCDHMTMFPSHSFEQYYQAVRRCWRFGQKNPVTVDIITTEGESGVLQNMQRKSEAADKMFSIIVKEMGNAMRIERAHNRNKKMEIPTWL